LCLLPATSLPAAEQLSVGVAELDITPDITKPVWIAGYGQNRQAKSVHDPLFVRAVVFKTPKQKVAFVAADVVGLQHPVTKEIRDRITGYDFVMIAATHNHEGPDTMGLWGPSPFKSGIDPAYMQLLSDQCVKAVQTADETAVPVQASYGTAQDEILLRDSREPYVYDDILRVLKFNRADNGQLHAVMLQWNCHPEAMGSDNTAITADFPWATVAKLKAKYNCPVAYFTGPVGGLMAPPRNGCVKNDAGQELKEGDFEYTRVYGEMVADLAIKALDACQPIELTPFVVSTKTITVPLENPLYKAAQMMGVLKRPGRAWTGNFEELGEPITPKNKTAQPAGETEVSYVRLGELHAACMPCEIYPEHVYGKIQDPVDSAADFPDAPLEPSIVDTLPGKKIWIFGLANDEIGYVVPKRQWDDKAPFCYNRTESQYGEENSIGAEAAPILMQALVNRVQEANGK